MRGPYRSSAELAGARPPPELHPLSPATSAGRPAVPLSAARPARVRTVVVARPSLRCCPLLYCSKRASILDVCIEQVLARNHHEGYLNQTGYQNFIKNFNERTKRNYVRKQFKNRWETLKKEYSTWKTLNQSASGLGRDPITKTIDASDEWWKLEIKRCPDAAKFLHAPLANEDKMCQIFDKHCVTNDHARVPLPTSLAGPSQGVPSSMNIDDDDISGTEIDVQVTPGTAGRGEKRACPYSPSPAVVEKMERDSAEKNCLRRICDIFEKREESRNSVTSQPS